MTDQLANLHKLIVNVASEQGLVAEACGLNADWNVEAWHLGPGEANRTNGAFYLLDDEDNDGLLLVRRFYVGEEGYEGDGFNDEVRVEFESDVANRKAVEIALAIAFGTGELIV